VQGFIQETPKTLSRLDPRAVEAIRIERHMILLGGAGSGRTTLLNHLVRHFFDGQHSERACLSYL
jgi:Flp pilus assembly CpaF family ATPase